MTKEIRNIIREEIGRLIEFHNPNWAEEDKKKPGEVWKARGKWGAKAKNRAETVRYFTFEEDARDWLRNYK